MQPGVNAGCARTKFQFAADGTVSGLVVFSVDVTQDKNKQAQLIQDRRQLQTKIEQRTQSLRESESKLATLSRMAPACSINS